MALEDRYIMKNKNFSISDLTSYIEKVETLI